MSGIVVALTDAKPYLVGQAGPEHCQDEPRNTALSEASGAQSGAVGAQGNEIAPDLAFLIQVWERLSTDIKTEILAMITQESAGKEA